MPVFKSWHGALCPGKFQAQTASVWSFVENTIAHWFILEVMKKSLTFLAFRTLLTAFTRTDDENTDQQKQKGSSAG